MFTFLKNLSGPKEDFAKLIRDGAVIIDVRSKSEYQSGHLSGSKNIPLENIQQEAEELKKLNKPVITVCRSGNRSGVAKSILSDAGIKAYNGGAWNSLKGLIQ